MVKTVRNVTRPGPWDCSVSDRDAKPATRHPPPALWEAVAAEYVALSAASLRAVVKAGRLNAVRITPGRVVYLRRPGRVSGQGSAQNRCGIRK
jgi:hypothetical protein